MGRREDVGLGTLRWIPFVLLCASLAVLTEVSQARELFVSRYGVSAWDNLHLYGSATLVISAYFAQPQGHSWWHKLAIALLLVLAAGLLRETRQAYAHGPKAFSHHDIRSNSIGAAIGALLSLQWSRCGKKRQVSQR